MISVNNDIHVLHNLWPRQDLPEKPSVLIFFAEYTMKGSEEMMK